MTEIEVLRLILFAMLLIVFLLSVLVGKVLTK